jgi:hypothetical protein
MRRLLPLVVLAALIAGCGGDDDGGSAELLTEAASKTTNEGSARIAFRGSSQGGLPQPIEFRGDGVVDNAKRLGQLEFDFGSLASALPPDAQLQAEDLTGEVIFEGFVFYMRFPLLANLLGDDKQWIKFDAKAIGEAQGLDLSQFTQFGQADPSQALQYLRAVSGEVEEKGEEEVRGVSTTRYSAEVDLRKFPDVLPEDQRDQAKQGADALIDQLGGDTTLPMDVWVDEDGLIRRQRFEFAFEPPTGGQRVSFRYDIELYDFGVEADVQPPPAAETADLTELLSRAAESAQERP